MEVDPEDDDAPVLPSDGEAVRGLDETHRGRSRPERMDETRFRRRVPFQPRGVPDLDESILRRRDEERVVWGDEEVDDGTDVLREMANKDGFGWEGGGGGRTGDGSEACCCGASTGANSRTEIWERISKGLKVDVLNE